MANRGRPPGTKLMRVRCRDCGMVVKPDDRKRFLCPGCANDLDFVLELGVSVRWQRTPSRPPLGVGLLRRLDVPGQRLFEDISDG